MTTEDILIQTFCIVDDEMKDMPKHSQAKLSPSKLVRSACCLPSKADIFGRFIAG